MDKQRDLETIELELAVLVRRATSTITNNKMGNLDRAAYLLLHQIHTNGSAGVRALADEFHLDVSTVSRQAAALEQKGYVFRTPDPSDKRAFTLQLTELGIQELSAHRKARLDRVTELLKNWSEEEIHLFGKLLRKFNRTFV
jgi:DNA-binding MarR family transcriptional regulator